MFNPDVPGSPPGARQQHRRARSQADLESEPAILPSRTHVSSSRTSEPRPSPLHSNSGETGAQPALALLPPGPRSDTRSCSTAPNRARRRRSRRPKRRPRPARRPIHFPSPPSQLPNKTSSPKSGQLLCTSNPVCVATPGLVVSIVLLVGARFWSNRYMPSSCCPLSWLTTRVSALTADPALYLIY